MRRMVRVTFLLLLSTVRKIAWPALLIAGVLTVIVSYLRVYPGEPALAVHMTAYGQLLLTITFMMLGIHLKHEPRHVYMDDVIAAYSHDNGFLLRCQLLVLIVADFIVTFIIIGAIYFSTLMGGSAVWTRQVIFHVILLYFFPCYALGVWGLLTAQWNAGRSVYLPAILGWVFTCSLAVDFYPYFDALGIESGRAFHSIFNMGVSNMRDIQGIVMTPPIERPWWVMRAVISIILTALLLGGNARRRAVVKAEKRRKTLIHCLIALFSVAVIVFLGMRYSVFFSRFADPAVRTEYTKAKANAYVPGKPVSLADYPGEKNIKIIKTDIILSCTSQGMQAQVQIEARMSKNAAGQSFTLYSDLAVDKVLVDGEIADFMRSNDGLMVYFSSGKALGQSVVFNFLYHGYSLPVFPANETTVQLNRSFPWFPWPGIKTATKYQNFFSFSESEDFFIENWQRGDDVEYTLRYNGPGNLYTNLVHQQDSIYKGSSSSGVSLYSGMAHEVIRGVDVFTPGSQNKTASWAVSSLLDSYAAIKDLSERMGTAGIPMQPKSIIVVEMAPPLVLSYPAPYPNELYAWSNDWEIRQTSTSATINTRASYGGDLSSYQNSLYVRAWMPITYLLAPCSGYPIDVPHSSTINFSSWLSYYLGAREEMTAQEPADEEDIHHDFGIVSTKDFYDFIEGVPVPGIPISAEEDRWKEAILHRMRSGENFDASFRCLYQRLLKEEMITPSEIITALYNNLGG